MNTIQIISGILLVIASLIIILVVLIQDSKDPGMTSAITGSSNDSFFGRNGSKTRDSKVANFTRVAAFIFFGVTLLVNILK
mgnify:FL=1